MDDAQPITLELQIDPQADPIRGRLTDDDGDAHEFVGWLGLASAIERLLTPATHQG